MITIKSENEIAILKKGGKILAAILKFVSSKAKPGISTFELNEIAEKMIYEQGGRPSFKNYGNPPYPAALCTSVNEEIVHGIPSKKTILKNGDIVSLDIGMQYPAVDGLYTDMAVTLPVGHISKQAKLLLKVTQKAIEIIEKHLKPGMDLQDIGAMVQNWVEKNNMQVIRDFVGHGVGYAVHEDPQIPNYVITKFHCQVQPGMVLAFEPMVSLGNYEVETKSDGWTAVTKDKSLTAHFEHTFVITKEGCEVITRA